MNKPGDFPRLPPGGWHATDRKPNCTFGGVPTPNAGGRVKADAPAVKNPEDGDHRPADPGKEHGVKTR